MEGRKGVFVDLSGRGNRRAVFVPGGQIELEGIEASATGTVRRIFYWYDEAVALRDALNRYLLDIEPAVVSGPVTVVRS